MEMVTGISDTVFMRGGYGESYVPILTTSAPDDGDTNTRRSLYYTSLNNDLEKIWKEAAVALTVPANLFDS
jgi:hypothetical protein